MSLLLDQVSGFGSPASEAIGWTLLHFAWQGAVIAALVAAALARLERREAAARYVACCAGLIAMAGAPLLTLVVVATVTASPSAVGVGPVIGAAPRLSTLITPHLPIVTIVWTTGVAVLTLRLLLQWLAARRLRRSGTAPIAPEIRSMADALCATLGVRRPVQVLESAIAPVPMLIGWLRPVILLPTAALCGLTPAQLHAILAHELAHVRRHDYLVNLLQVVIETFLFFHPAVWWLSSRLRAEREYCCDDIVVGACADVRCYARALAALEDLRAAGLPALASTGGSLMNRIARLAGAGVRPAHHLGRWTAAAVIASTATVVVSAAPVAKVAPAEAPVVEGSALAALAVDPAKAMDASLVDPAAAELVAALAVAGDEPEDLVRVIHELLLADEDGASHHVIAQLLSREIGFAGPTEAVLALDGERDARHAVLLELLAHDRPAMSERDAMTLAREREIIAGEIALPGAVDLELDRVLPSLASLFARTGEPDEHAVLWRLGAQFGRAHDPKRGHFDHDHAGDATHPDHDGHRALVELHREVAAAAAELRSIRDALRARGGHDGGYDRADREAVFDDADRARDAALRALETHGPAWRDTAARLHEHLRSNTQGLLDPDTRDRVEGALRRHFDAARQAWHERGGPAVHEALLDAAREAAGADALSEKTARESLDAARSLLHRLHPDGVSGDGQSLLEGTHAILERLHELHGEAPEDPDSILGRVHRLEPDEVQLRRMSERLAGLMGGADDLVPRLRALRDAIDELLDAAASEDRDRADEAGSRPHR